MVIARICIDEVRVASGIFYFFLNVRLCGKLCRPLNLSSKGCGDSKISFAAKNGFLCSIGGGRMVEGFFSEA